MTEHFSLLWGQPSALLGYRHRLGPALEEPAQVIDRVGDITRPIPIRIPILRSHGPATSDSHQLVGNNPQQRCIENQREYDNAFHVYTLSMY